MHRLKACANNLYRASLLRFTFMRLPHPNVKTIRFFGIVGFQNISFSLKVLTPSQA
jgi:hypothetical protein